MRIVARNAAVAALLWIALASAEAQTLAPAPASRAPAAAAAPLVLPDGPDAYRIAADEWLKRHKPASFVLAVKRGGRIVHQQAQGASADQPTLIASLSKMITGLCVATLVRDGKLDFATPMRSALTGFFARHGQPKDSRFLNVTVEELLIHRSGLMGNPDGDVVHRIIARVAREGRGATASIPSILAEHLTHPMKRAPGADFAYSNAGYVALGVVIEEASGRPYEDYCRDAVMTPLGVASARLHPDWRILSSMGGWIIAPADYLALGDVFAPGHPFLGAKVRAWIDAMKTTGTSPSGDWYSLGTITHGGNGRWSVMHGGQLNSRGVDARKKPVAATVRATFARAPDGTAMFAAFTPAHYDNKALGELRGLMSRATQAWKGFR
jgi:CubicO group peptidase (beta-lactamase class C family)